MRKVTDRHNTVVTLHAGNVSMVAQKGQQDKPRYSIVLKGSQHTYTRKLGCNTSGRIHSIPPIGRPLPWGCAVEVGSAQRCSVRHQRVNDVIEGRVKDKKTSSYRKPENLIALIVFITSKDLISTIKLDYLYSATLSLYH